MRPRRLLTAVSIATLCCLGAAAGPAAAQAPGPTGAQGKPVDPKAQLVIARLAPETGDLAPLLDALRTPVKLAVDEINAAGGVNGQPVTLVTGDDGTDTATVARTVETLLGTDGARIIIGPAASPTAAAILGDIKGKALMCSGSNSAAALDQDGPEQSGGLYFRTAPPDSLQGPALAELLLADGRTKVAVLAREDSWLSDVGKSLTDELEQGGAKVVAQRAFAADGGNAESVVAKVLAKKPDSVVVLGQQDDGAKVLQALIAAGAGPAVLPIYTSNGMQSTTFAASVDPANPGAVAGIRGTAPATAPAGLRSPFQAAFASTNIEPVFSAHTYDCTILAALAAVKAKSTDPAKVAKAFTANLRGNQDCDTFASCQALLAAGKSIHWRGASSRFDAFGKFQPDEGVYDVWGYDANGAVVTEPPSSQITIR
jgi:ABC-type branched-subunit amino acid transport system substrate-binding protein